MPYTALYRKKRPRTFGEIIGQQHIKRALLNQLMAGRVSHAYLFCGTRGTGKTSAAKIFARAVNCTAPQDGEPCNTCELCKNILAERCLDVAEIDAASNNGVDNIRDLREEVKYLPTMGRYKVYIVDEVHMLSSGAFNALLKTLEEPPEHVIFILATTDPQKIPATILSRCQRYDFRRISAEQMTVALQKYLTEENRAFEPDALEYIAYHSDGAMRDALSLLDQCLAAGEELTIATVQDVLGAVDRARLFEFADALFQKDTAQIIEIITRAMDDGRDEARFAADLVRHFRDVLVAGLDGGDFHNEAKYKAQAAKIPQNFLMQCITAFSEVQREMRFAPHKRTAFEVCALQICTGGGELRVESGELRVGAVPAAVSGATPPATPHPHKPTSLVGDFSRSEGGSAVRATLTPRDFPEVGATQPTANAMQSTATTAPPPARAQNTIDKIKAQLSGEQKLAPQPQEAYNEAQQQAHPQAQIQQSPQPTVPDDWASFGQEIIGDETF